ncbi:SEC-C domain-containing protein [Acidiferrimicrobium sp. IK]|uniref:SEC-C domain-containing protein n=1 Tax=Acidiferrimicrobium sp. IK TaxID=2871700 RepID=UPI0021CAF3A0|nr:SEC-C domain-containing protein [Acidiferrimicrobium sp. IK]MCU4186737.1 SEC-C domain-containing protein [Acidiferrimicrobium sp. IK]
MSLAWFPRGEWEKATAVWPDLLEGMPADHAEYSRRIEARLKRLARSLPGHPVRVGSMTVDGLTAFSADDGADPGSGQARSSYAAELARRGEAKQWPPGRNAPCWCGSGRKYKACCGPAPMAPE